MRSGSLALLLVIAVTTSVFAAPKRHAASPDRCTEIVTPPTLSFPASGGQAFVTVTVKGGCTWSPVPSDSWITATSSSTAMTVTAAPNSATAQRTSLIHVRSTVVVVTQDATTNLLQNGSFDMSLTAWSSGRSVNGMPPQWVNGTAVVTSGNGKGIGQLDQCVNIDPSTRYQAGAKVLIPSGQTGGTASFGIFEYAVPNCDPIGASRGNKVNQLTVPIGTWFDTTVNWTSDATAKSVLITIGAGSLTGPFTADFDDVYLRRTP